MEKFMRKNTKLEKSKREEDCIKQSKSKEVKRDGKIIKYKGGLNKGKKPPQKTPAINSFFKKTREKPQSKMVRDALSNQFIEFT